MASYITPVFSYATLVSHFLFVFLLLAFVYRKSWGKDIIGFVSKYALWLGFGAAAFSIVGSLLYSEILGYAACSLCWWQRVMLYPQAALFLVAIMKKDRGVFDYVLPLTLIAFLISLYQSYVNLGGTSILPCTAAGSECSKVFVMEFGYITIPLMSLTLTLYLLFINLCARKNDNNSNA